MEKDYVVNAGLPIHMSKEMHIIVLFSMIADLLIAALIYFNKELHAHPMKLFMLASLAEYSYFQSVYLGSFACRIGWIKLFQMTVLFNVDFDDLHWRWHTMQILYNAQSFFMLFFWMMSILLNTVICYDLMFILYHPFKSP